MTEQGNQHIEEILKKNKIISTNDNLYDIKFSYLIHHINQALKAHHMFSKDSDYIVSNNQVIIIDEFTGRAMEGRRFGDGLHQAIEAKEGIVVQQESQTLAAITFQNFFRMYDKISGMTGTASTEANELDDIYNLKVFSIPTHKPINRKDYDDSIYRTAKEKNDAIIKQVEQCVKKKQPILIGTASIEQSETISKLLQRSKIKHVVLNAKNHEQEADIIAEAGSLGAVTIATNMAGRGTDIVLGGNLELRIQKALQKHGEERDNKDIIQKLQQDYEQEKQEVINTGGLFVLGTERHESRRIDNQLRGRSGRQGDNGETKFYLSLEDNLMRVFGSEKLSGILKTLGLTDGQEISHPLINRSLSRAQSKVEAQNYEVRKTLLKFDNVVNEQRKIIYSQRKEVINKEDIISIVKKMYQELNKDLINAHINNKTHKAHWDTKNLENILNRLYNRDLRLIEYSEKEGILVDDIIKYVDDIAGNIITAKEEKYGHELISSLYKRIIVITIDELWKDHLLALDNLRQGINLRAYGQKDPLNEYKRESLQSFNEMLDNIKQKVINIIVRSKISTDMDHNNVLGGGSEVMFNHHQNSDIFQNVSRNSPCPCNSGRKYKHCHGKI